MSGYWRNPSVVCAELEDGAVLLNLESKYYYSFNRTGMAVWSGIEPALDLPELASRLASTYQADREAVAAGVAALMAELEGEGLVGRAGAEPADADFLWDTGGVVEFQREADEEWEAPKLTKHLQPLSKVIMAPFDPSVPIIE